MKSHNALRVTMTLAILLSLPLMASCAKAQDSDEAEEPASAASMTLDSEEQKTLYALGMAVGQNLSQLGLSTEELETVKMGIIDSALGNEPQVTMQEYGPKIQAFAQGRMQLGAERAKASGAELLEKHAAEEGAQRTDSGLVIKEITPGTGAQPLASDTVTVHYHGTLQDGKVFDSSVDRGQPATFGLGQVVPCWTEGVQMIKVGGKSRLTCPSDLAYGDQGRPGIPPGATLVFEVELISIKSSESSESSESES